MTKKYITLNKNRINLGLKEKRDFTQCICKNNVLNLNEIVQNSTKKTKLPLPAELVCYIF